MDRMDGIEAIVLKKFTSKERVLAYNLRERGYSVHEIANFLHRDYNLVRLLVKFIDERILEARVEELEESEEPEESEELVEYQQSDYRSKSPVQEQLEYLNELNELIKSLIVIQQNSYLIDYLMKQLQF